MAELDTDGLAQRPAPLRCPFCHAAVRRDEEAWVACAACVARHHSACWEDMGRCGSCGHGEHLVAPTRDGSSSGTGVAAQGQPSRTAASGDAQGRLSLRRALREGLATFVRPVGWLLVAWCVVQALMVTGINATLGDATLPLMALTGVLSAVSWSLAVSSVSGEPPRLPRRLWRATGAGALSALLVTAGLVMLIIPGIVLDAYLAYVIPRVVFEDRPVMDALRDSWRTVSRAGARRHVLLAALALAPAIVLAFVTTEHEGGALGRLVLAVTLDPLLWAAWGSAYLQTGSPDGARTAPGPSSSEDETKSGKLG